MPCDFDLDDLFAYKVERRVIIRERKLGIARIVILLGVFVYVVIYEVILRKGYLQRDEPLGFATLTARRGSWTFDDRHCCPRTGCGFACTGPDPCPSHTQEPTCTATQGCTWGPAPSLPASAPLMGRRLECVEWDRHNMLHPPTEEYSLLLTSRLTVTESKELPPECRLNRTSAVCPPWEMGLIGSFFTTGLEGMTIRVDHGVYGKETDKVVRSKDMSKGEFVNWNGDTAFRLEGRDNGDIFTVEQLLGIAGIETLDAKVGDIKTEGDSLTSTSPDTMRYDGVVILVLIGYDGQGIDTEITYNYRAFPLGGLEFKSEQVVYREHPNGNITRIVWNRHGLRLVFASSGYLVQFSFIEMMKTVMVASGLFSVATFLVEVIIIRLLPFSSAYRRYRDVKTIDFSDFTKDSLRQLSDIDYSLGVVRNDGKGLGAIHADDEREVGDKIDAKVDNMKETHPPPTGFIPPSLPPLPKLGSGGSSPAHGRPVRPYRPDPWGGSQQAAGTPAPQRASVKAAPGGGGGGGGAQPLRPHPVALPALTPASQGVSQSASSPPAAGGGNLVVV